MAEGKKKTVAKSEATGAMQNGIALRLFLSTSTTLFIATGFQSFYTTPPGLLLASVFVLPSYVTIFCHTAYFLP
jgi:hypothetical protein